MIRCLQLILLVTVAVFLSCNDTPEIVFPELESNAIVSGRVLPAFDSVMVYLVGARQTDSTKCNKDSELFQFDNVPYGAYLLKVTAPGYGIYETWITVDRPVNSLSYIELSKSPYLISYVRPYDGTKIDTAFLKNRNYATDSTIEINIYFEEKMDTASVIEALVITPSIRGIRTRWSSLNGLYISIPRWELDTLSEIDVIIKKTAKSIYTHSFEMDFTLSYPVGPIDREIDSTVLPQLIYTCTPRDGDRNILPSDPIKIQFDTLMDEVSFEKAFKIEPECQTYFTWESLSRYSRVTIGFINGLKLGTRYKVSLNSGWHAIDSTRIGGAYSFQFATEDARITRMSPKNGEVGVSLKSYLQIYLNFEPDFDNFKASFSIDPPVDSLNFTYDASEKDVHVYHKPFENGTVYTITIDTTLKTNNGVNIYRTFSASFVTYSDEVPWKPDTSTLKPVVKKLLWESNVSDTIAEWPVNRTIEISFSNEMDAQKVESLLVITPQPSYYTVWSIKRTSASSIMPFRNVYRLEIIPRHYLESNTTYTVHLDSGYCAVDSVKNDSITLSFTTQPLRCIGFIPAHKQQNVPRDAPLALTFNMPIDTSTLNSAVTFTPQLTHTLKDSVVIDKEANTWTYFILHDQMLSDTTIEISVAATVTDLFGITVERGFSVEFLTGN